ncbi:MAG TPA: non-canonical purine NTP pyrophosphatase [Granulicella sp.]
MRLYVATSNPGKLRDFAAALTGLDLSIEPLPGLSAIAPPPEDEPTFFGNAVAKAVYYSSFAPGYLALADDSGLEVDALDGAPGVRSARYSEDQDCPFPPATTLDERNNLCLLRALDEMSDRTARYHCVLAAARDGSLLATADGCVEGTILTAPRGTGGFGYDPLFYLPELKRTMAEIDAVEKLGFSHRGNALRRLLPLLQGM